MGTLKDLANVIEEAKELTAETEPADVVLIEEVIPQSDEFKKKEEYCCAQKEFDNQIFYVDNLKLLKRLAEDDAIRGKLKLIYIDPPFFSESNYDAVVKVGGKNVRHPAYDDKWQKGMYDYLQQLTARLVLLRELLADDGLIWLHLDWHAAHYARILMDEIFGEKNFVNEVIWNYKSGGSSKRHFARKHDNLLVYSKTGNYQFHPLKEKSYNRQFKPYRFKGVKEYRDELGWYTMVNMKDVWQIDMVGRTSAERTGYATQKPEELLERIISCSTEPGDLCADFFCGSGTLPAVAARMGRRFLACDKGRLAIEHTAGRLCNQGTSFKVYAEGAIRNGENHQPSPVDDVQHQEDASGLRVEIQVSLQQLAGSDSYMVTIGLGTLYRGRFPARMEEESKTVIRRAAKEDPLSLIESWSVDFHYDGQVHRPQCVFVRGKKGLECTARQVLKPIERCISIKIVDVMGNVFYGRQEL